MGKMVFLYQWSNLYFYGMSLTVYRNIPLIIDAPNGAVSLLGYIVNLFPDSENVVMEKIFCDLRHSR